MKQNMQYFVNKNLFRKNKNNSNNFKNYSKN